jgi:hypothetical protein
VAFFVRIRHLIKRLRNSLQLLVTSQTSPIKGLTAVAIHRIPNSLTNLALYLDQFLISRYRRYGKRGDSGSLTEFSGTGGSPPRSWRMFLRNWSS